MAETSSGTGIVEGWLTTPSRELWSLDTQQREGLQGEVFRQRFNALKPKVTQLAKLAALQNVSEVCGLSDAPPLLFQHTVYKSYPISLVEKRRFDLLTRWLDGLTAHDLSRIDVSGCDSFDSWFDAVEAQTPLLPNHSTGTTGKLSIIPRDRREVERFEACHTKQLAPFGDEPDRLARLKGDGGPVPIVYPSYRRGRHVAQRMLDGLVRNHGSEATTYVLYDDFMSADVASLAGRVRGASVKGTLDDIDISPELLARFKTSMERQANQAADQERFFDRVLKDLRGRKVFAFGVVPLQYNWMLLGEARGVEQLFAPESVISTGGGMKGVAVPDDWRERVERFLGAELRFGYGMSECISGNVQCPCGNYHPLPFTAVFVLDPETGAPLPREGTQTGRYAFFDLLAESFWGGFVTGDKVTVTWDGCACGRRGPYFHPKIERFSELEGGDDKISCSGSNDAHEEAMAWLISRANEL